MALKRAYIFRDRDILVEGGGDAAGAETVASFVDADIASRFDDRANACSGILLRPGTPAPEGTEFQPLSAYFFAHDEEENARAARIKGLCSWLEATRFCPSCGQPLQMHSVENALECPACGRLLFPRVDSLFRHTCNHFFIGRIIIVPQKQRVCFLPIIGIPNVVVLVHFGDKDKQTFFLNRAA